MLAAVIAWTGCGEGPAADAASSTGAASAASPAAIAASVAPSASASASAAAIASHAPGTVPTAAPKPPPRDDRLPPVPPKIERGATAAASRKGPKGLTSAAWLDDARVAMDYAGRLDVLEVEKGATTTLVTGARVTSVAARGATVVTLDESNRVVVWDLDEKSPPRAWTAFASFTGTSWDADAAIALSPKRDRVAVSSGGEVVAWDLATGKELAQKRAEGTVWSLAVTSSEVGFAVNATSYHAWGLDADKETGTGSFATGGTFNITVSPDLRWAAGSAPAGHGLQVSDVHGPQSLRTLVGDTDCAHHVSAMFSSDSRYLYALLGPDRVKGFATESWKPYASYAAEPGRMIRSMADDLSRVVTTKEHAAPEVVHVGTRKATPLDQPFDLATEHPYAINPAGTMIVATETQESSSRRLRVWSAKTGKRIYEVTPD